jgi:3-oxoacyl-[acyl-carrier protein] reductase
MKNILIIGGSKGIGSAILLQQLEKNLVINISRNSPDLTHANLTHYPLDVLNDSLPDIGNIDSLIYCPGSINLKPIGSLSIDDFRNDFEINVIGINPSIILFSTVATRLGMPFHASIATAKAGVEGLVKSLGAELASVVRINAIAPTITDTTLAASILRNDRIKENMVERHPMKSYLKPEEVANMANYLISDQAKSISGQVFVMDYGIVSFKI